MASGPCGECTPEETACYERSDLMLLRESALASAEAVGGAAGAAGDSALEKRAPRVRASPGAGGAPEPFNQLADDLRETELWDNAEGCPTRDQIDAIWRLNGREAPRWDILQNTTDEQCCYKSSMQCNGGRPFLVAGSPRVAELVLAGTAPASACEQSELRRALGAHWTAEALTEHASVAAFARLTLQLLALGAPVALIEASQRAALDELAHARFCFAQASQFVEYGVTPGALALDGAFADESFAEFVRTNLLEGCIGESLAAMRMNERAQLAADPALSAALRAIGEDETRHAELAFRILSWCTTIDASVTHRVVSDVIAARAIDCPAVPTAANPAWSREGQLSPDEAAYLDGLVWEKTLLPLLRALAGGPAVLSHERGSDSLTARAGGAA